MALGQQSDGLALQLAERHAGGAVDQDVADRVAGPGPHGPEPRIGEFPRRESVGGAGNLDVRLAAEDQLPGLPVVAGLRAPGEAGRTGRIVARRAPPVAEIAAQIEAGPAIGAERRGGGVIRRMRKVGRARGARRDRHQERCRACNPCHAGLYLAATSKRWFEAKAAARLDKFGVISLATMSNPKLNLSESLNRFATAWLRNRITAGAA